MTCALEPTEVEEGSAALSPDMQIWLTRILYLQTLLEVEKYEYAPHVLHTHS